MRTSAPGAANGAPADGKCSRYARIFVKGNCMLTADGCRGRRSRLWNALPDGPDLILLSSPRNLTYFTGFYPSPFLFSSQNASALLILRRDGSSVLVADNLLDSFARRSFVDDVEMPTWYRSRE